MQSNLKECRMEVQSLEEEQMLSERERYAKQPYPKEHMHKRVWMKNICEKPLKWEKHRQTKAFLEGQYVQQKAGMRGE